MTSIRPIQKLMIAGDPAKADAIILDCRHCRDVGCLSEQGVEYMREIAEACSPPDRPIAVYVLRG